MRPGKLYVAAICAASWCTSAQAQQTISTSTTTTGGTVLGTVPSSGLAAFSDTLGTLTGITLQIDDLTQTAYHASGDGYTTTDIASTGTFHSIVNGVAYSVGISGNQEVSYGSFTFLILSASGSSTFTIDPALFSTFIGTADNCGSVVGICATDYANVAPTLSGVPTGSSFSGQEFESQATYTLTYTYTPGIPEPATWVMMLLGFGGIGFQIRRKRTRPSLATTESQVIG